MFSANGIRAVLFDLDGTLRHSLPTSNQAFFTFAAHLGVIASVEDQRRAARWVHYYWAQSPELAQDLQAFTELTDPFWTWYSRRCLLALGCSEAQAEILAPAIQDRMRLEYQPLDWVPPDVPETLGRLKQCGFALAVVSNRDQAFIEQLTALNLISYFDFALAAGEINSWKPDAGIFQHAAQRLQLHPEQVIYVGDNYFADVVGARLAGMQPVLIDPEGIFEKADCPVITRLSDLLRLIGELKDNPQPG